MTHNEWWDERRKWASERGVELPSRVGSDDADLAEEWSWHPERWATPDEWRAALFAWEDEHGRLRHLPSVPFEPAGRGTYDLSTGRWEPL
ncbi:hypothetical protein GXB85_04165 [Cellulomonas sp. APG4]|uniref:hypothetical protein n=1 Tax=Cellulomonas sp. APG4 TaxID=1538656 RepID=UPI00137B0031|nr:hypothetical protein [Cellulomonas sp. APG4]NCT90148.1 hypothetical protein [Cellulomonas sp. APG4]